MMTETKQAGDPRASFKAMAEALGSAERAGYYTAKGMTLDRARDEEINLLLAERAAALKQWAMLRAKLTAQLRQRCEDLKQFP